MVGITNMGTGGVSERSLKVAVSSVWRGLRSDLLEYAFGERTLAVRNGGVSRINSSEENCNLWAQTSVNYLGIHLFKS